MIILCTLDFYSSDTDTSISFLRFLQCMFSIISLVDDMSFDEMSLDEMPACDRPMFLHQQNNNKQ